MMYLVFAWLAAITVIAIRASQRPSVEISYEDDRHIYRAGETVRVYSLQSFSEGGFLCGTVCTVRQDQIGMSVLLDIPGREHSYEVYPQQIRRVT